METVARTPDFFFNLFPIIEKNGVSNSDVYVNWISYIGMLSSYLFT